MILGSALVSIESGNDGVSEADSGVFFGLAFMDWAEDSLCVISAKLQFSRTQWDDKACRAVTNEALEYRLD